VCGGGGGEAVGEGGRRVETHREERWQQEEQGVRIKGQEGKAEQLGQALYSFTPALVGGGTGEAWKVQQGADEEGTGTQGQHGNRQKDEHNSWATADCFSDHFQTSFRPWRTGSRSSTQPQP
jgi:hypothetical protein